MENCFKVKLVYGIGLTIAALGGLVFSEQTFAQVTPDRTLGSERSVVNQNVTIKGVLSDRVDGGARRGANLFHSFLDFNVAAGRGVYFGNPADVGNILSRVTGGNASSIAGRLGVLGGANLFLLNPNGIIFGPNASLDVAGSFVASTASSLRFGDGTEYSATNPDAPSLLMVSVPLGVQFGKEQSRAIVNRGNLTTGNNLALIGGTVVSTGQLNAPTGNVAAATVPAESAVNLSATGQFLSVNTPSTTTPTSSSASLVELVQGNGAGTGLALNPNGQVELAGLGLPIVEGDVAVRQLAAKTATLTANHNLTLVESQLQTTGDLNLLAQGTVRVRDSVTFPFSAQAGGNLFIQGNQGIDILALNHPEVPFQSGGNLTLMSGGTVSGDAHFSSRGNFSILNLSGQPGNFVSLYDPIISSTNDVTFGDYVGTALKVESRGSIKAGNIRITGPDALLIGANPNDPDIQDLTAAGGALILRAGVTSLLYPITIAASDIFRVSSDSPSPPLGDLPTVFPNGAVPLPPGSITVGNITASVFNGNAGKVIVNTQGEGDISTGAISSFVDVGGQGDGGAITLVSKSGSITTSGNLNSSTVNGKAGDITLTALKNITTDGIQSYSAAGGKGDAGNITLTSTGSNGIVNTTRGTLYSSAQNGQGGTVKITATGDILTAGIQSLAITGSGGGVTLDSSSGGIDTTAFAPGFDGKTFSGLNSQSFDGLAGGIYLTAHKEIKTSSIIASSVSDSRGSIIINPIKKIRDNVTSTIFLESSAGSVTIGTAQANPLKNFGCSASTCLITTNSKKAFAGDIIINAADDIKITNNTSIESRGNNGFIFIGNSNFSPDLTPKTITIQNSSINATNIFPDGTALLQKDAGQVRIQAQVVTADNSKITATGAGLGSTGGLVEVTATNLTVEKGAQITAEALNGAQGGNIQINTTESTITGSNSKVSASGLDPDSIAGRVKVVTNKLTVENGAQVNVSNPGGVAGDLYIFADRVVLNQGTLSADTGKSPKNETRANIFLLGKEAANNDPTTSLLRAVALKQSSQTINAQLGNETISPLRFLIMENGSKITATADPKSNASGGNIFIKTQVLLAPKTGSKIQANAGIGNGGNIFIFAKPLGIYNIEFRSTGTTTLNDITATSLSGANGIVSITVPDVSPARDLNQLSEDLADASRKIAVTCPIAGQRGAANQFVVTGRGSLPETPDSALNSNVLVGEQPLTATQPDPRLPTAANTTETPSGVEAQGVEIGAKGEFILTAHPSRVEPSSPWQPFQNCVQQ